MSARARLLATSLAEGLSPSEWRSELSVSCLEIGVIIDATKKGGRDLRYFLVDTDVPDAHKRTVDLSSIHSSWTVAVARAMNNPAIRSRIDQWKAPTLTLPSFVEIKLYPRLFLYIDLPADAVETVVCPRCKRIFRHTINSARCFASHPENGGNAFSEYDAPQKIAAFWDSLSPAARRDLVPPPSPHCTIPDFTRESGKFLMAGLYYFLENTHLLRMVRHVVLMEDEHDINTAMLDVQAADVIARRVMKAFVEHAEKQLLEQLEEEAVQEKKQQMARAEKRGRKLAKKHATKYQALLHRLASDDAFFKTFLAPCCPSKWTALDLEEGEQN